MSVLSVRTTYPAEFVVGKVILVLRGENVLSSALIYGVILWDKLEVWKGKE